MSEKLFEDAHDKSIEVIDGRLWYMMLEEGVGCPASTNTHHYFELDPSYQYERFFADFGPLHLGHTVNFLKLIEDLLRSEVNRKLFLCSPNHPHLVANTAVMLGIYQIVKLGKTAEEAYLPFFVLKLPPFRDAVFAVCTYCLTVLDVLRGVSKALALKHFEVENFDVEDYNHYSRIENGDLNWVVPSKFLAFSGPLAVRRELEPGKTTLTPEDYVPVFKRLGVSSVVRFNKKCYDRRKFVDSGIRHHDLYYEDGGNPSDAILQKFLDICEKDPGAIAVHCKAGLGRTGTNIGAYMMKHYGYTASECIAWSRVCRPGMVNGPQQQYLECLEDRIMGEPKIMSFQALQTHFSSTDGSLRSGSNIRSGSASKSPSRRRGSIGLSTQHQDGPRVLSPISVGYSKNKSENGRIGATPVRRRPQSTNPKRTSHNEMTVRGRGGAGNARYTNDGRAPTNGLKHMDEWHGSSTKARDASRGRRSNGHANGYKSSEMKKKPYSQGKTKARDDSLTRSPYLETLQR